MEAGSEAEINRNANQDQSPAEGATRPKRQMKTPFQLEVLEKTYAMEAYPSEATRAELSEKLGLTDRQLQMWFCHRRLKDKKETVAVAGMKPRVAGSGGRKGLAESPKEEFMMTTDPDIGPTLGSDSSSDSESESSQFDSGDDSPVVPTRYYESPSTIMEQRAIACVELQLGEPLREDGPILGVEFDEPPPGAFGTPIASMTALQGRFRKSYDGKFSGQYQGKHMKASSVDPHEVEEFKIRTDAYGLVAPSYFYNSPVNGAASKSPSLVCGNGYLPREHSEDQVKSMDNNNDNLQIGRRRKSNETRTEREIQAHEKKMRKEQEKQELLRRKREEQMRKEMEKQERERQKEELRVLREQQKQEEKFQREERREMERREKFMQKELLREERRKQKEERLREKEAARQKAALERVTARRMAKESMELIEDERLELMELAASSKGLPSIVSLDYDTLQNLESFRGSLCEFPPKSVQLRLPFAIQPWIDSDENVGNLLMVWKFLVTFADVLGLWPFTLDEFVQSLHDYDSRLLGVIHMSLIKLIIKDIEDVVRTPSGGPGTNQYTAVNTEGGHPHVIEGAYMWGFDIRNWQKHLNPLTWPEILRQFALSAGLGPQLKKKGADRVSSIDKDESRGCEDIVSTLRNGSAAVNAVAIMQEKGRSLQRKSRHRLTPGTVKYAAYHVLAFEGNKGLNVIEIAEKIQKSGLRDLTSSKTPEASISVALSRDPILFERTAPSTYCVRPAFRKDPADAEAIIASAKEKIVRYANGFLADQNADEEEKDDDSDSDAAEVHEVDALSTALNTNRNEPNEVGSCFGNSKEKLPESGALENEICFSDVVGGNPDQAVEIDESQTGEPWVQGLTEGEYSDLSVEERLNALVALIGIANEGNTIRLVLEERMDAANALKKQMLAEAQLDKRKLREDFINKFCDSSLNATAEGGLSPQVTKNYDPSSTTLGKDDTSIVADDDNTAGTDTAQELSMGHFVLPTQQSGHITERSRLQLKSYIGHRAEELYVYRSLPLGQDRRRNRYWYFAASASCLDPGSSRIFVESPKGNWRLIDSEEAFDALLTSLDTRGTRESHLHIMLQKIRVIFKESIKRNQLISTKDHNRYGGRQDAVKTSGSSSDMQVPSLSFRIDIGRNETEKSNIVKRYRDLQNWVWKECFNSSILHAMAYGKERCSPLLRVCDVCLATYDAEQDICTSCYLNHSQVDTKGNFSGQFESKNDLADRKDILLSSSSPVTIKLIKAILTLLEISVPSEALHPSWTRDHRQNWGLDLQNSSFIEDLLQIVTQLESAIKCDNLSENFETAEDLLSYCNLSRGEFAYTRSSGQIPWIPRTTAAVALRLLELDEAIFYSDVPDEKKIEVLPKFALRYGHPKDTKKAGNREFDGRGVSIKEGKRVHLHNTPSNSRQAQGGRARAKSQKLVKGPMSQPARQSVKPGRTLNHLLSHQRVGGTPVQKFSRGPRTVRKRKVERKHAVETPEDGMNDKDTFEDFLEEPRNCSGDAADNLSPENYVQNNDSSNSMEADAGSDDNNYTDENLYRYVKWGAGTYEGENVQNRSNVAGGTSEEEDEDEDDDGIEEENGYNAEEDGSLRGDMEIDDEDSDRARGNIDEDSESMSCGDYSD